MVVRDHYNLDEPEQLAVQQENEDSRYKNDDQELSEHDWYAFEETEVGT